MTAEVENQSTVSEAPASVVEPVEKITIESNLANSDQPPTPTSVADLGSRSADPTVAAAIPDSDPNITEPVSNTANPIVATDESNSGVIAEPVKKEEVIDEVAATKTEPSAAEATSVVASETDSAAPTINTETTTNTNSTVTAAVGASSSPVATTTPKDDQTEDKKVDPSTGEALLVGEESSMRKSALKKKSSTKKPKSEKSKNKVSFAEENDVFEVEFEESVKIRKGNSGRDAPAQQPKCCVIV